MKKEQKKYEYSYEVDDNSVDINALLVSQLHFSTVVNEIHKKLNPDVELSIRVIAPKKGSFVFQQIFEFVYASNLLSHENVNYLSDLFKVVSGFISLKTWLKGKKAESVITHDGDTFDIKFEGETRNVSINIYKIYSEDKIINSAMEKAFEAIEKDELIDGLTIQDDAPIAEVKREDFQSLINANEYLDGELQEEIKPSVKLFVKNPDLVPKNPKKVKWDFLYEGISKISATITDKKFLQDMGNTKYRLGAWDSLIVDLKVISKYNQEYKLHLPDSYEVTKVHKVTYRPSVTQTKIDD